MGAVRPICGFLTHQDQPAQSPDVKRGLSLFSPDSPLILMPMTDRYEYKPKFGFDIRIKPDTEEPTITRGRTCEWPSCDKEATCRAPLSPNQLGKTWWLCKEHARQHNQSWDYFRGMSDDAFAAHREAESTGFRPTWRMGHNSAAQSTVAERARERFKPGAGRHRLSGFAGAGTRDTYGLFGRGGQGESAPGDDAAVGAPSRPLTRLQRAALQDLGLEETAGLNEVKARYKELVKRFHPDANGGDRGAEDSLQRVLRAYQVLKTSGFR